MSHVGKGNEWVTSDYGSSVCRQEGVFNTRKWVFHTGRTGASEEGKERKDCYGMVSIMGDGALWGLSRKC